MNLRLAASILFFLSLYLHATAYNNDRETRRQTGLKRRHGPPATSIYPEKRRAPGRTSPRSYHEKKRMQPVRTPPRPYPKRRRQITTKNARRSLNAAGHAKAQLRRSNAERKSLSSIQRLMPIRQRIPVNQFGPVKIYKPTRTIVSMRRNNMDENEVDTMIDTILKYIFSQIQKLNIIPVTDKNKIIPPDEEVLEESFDKLLDLLFDEVEKYTKSSGNSRRMNNAGPITRRMNNAAEPITRRMNNAAEPMTRRMNKAEPEPRKMNNPEPMTRRKNHAEPTTRISFSKTSTRRSDTDDEELDTAMDTILRLFFSEFQKMNISTCLGEGDGDLVVIPPNEEEIDSALDYVLELIFVELQNHNIIPKEESRRIFRTDQLFRSSDVGADELDNAIENILKFIFVEIQKHNEAIVPSAEEDKVTPPDDAELQASFELILKLILGEVDYFKNIFDGKNRRMNTRRTDFHDISEEELDTAVENILRVIFYEIQKHNMSTCMGLDPNDETITLPSDKELDTALDNILNLIFHELENHKIIPTEGNNRRMAEDDSEPIGIFSRIYNFFFKKAAPKASASVETSKDDGESRRALTDDDEIFNGDMETAVKRLLEEIEKIKSQIKI